MKKKIIDVKDLSINFNFNNQLVKAVNGSSFTINEGECFSIVGESGSGKSVTAMSMMRLLKENSNTHIAGQIKYNNKDILRLNEKELSDIRGKKISMIFQEPMTSLNPLHTIKKQIKECIIDLDNTDKKIINLLNEVGIEDANERLNFYPHQLSGGQRQRVMIAMAIANKPDLLIADEPTTALDVTIQKQILDLLNGLRRKFKMSLLLITHDLSIVKKIADKVAVMEKGKIVEQGSTNKIFKSPSHPYTLKLINSKPTLKKFKSKSNHVILKTENLNIKYKIKDSFFNKRKVFFHAVKKLNLEIKEGQTLGIVGESGSGKSSLALALLKLINSDGQFFYNGLEISKLKERDFRPFRKNIQIIFQDPFASLSPRLTIEKIISEGLEIHRKELSAKDISVLTGDILEKVGLDKTMLSRYPHEFSGGQRQRIAIARALILEPKLIILDEPTSALDMTVQKQIVDLLLKLQQELSLTYVFISHDLKIVRALSDEIMVMKSGEVVERGAAEKIFLNPKNNYTKNLINSAFI